MNEYKSPIEIIYEQVRYEMDNEIMRAVQGVCINVDKNELVRALAYDRDQYQKGFQDGKADIVRCKECKWSYWQDETEWTYEGLYCKQYEASMHDDDYCSRGERKMK